MSGSSSNFQVITSHFPALPAPQFPPNTPVMIKVGQLLKRMSEVNVHLSNLKLDHEKFERFIVDKNEIDLLVKENLSLLCKHSSELRNDLSCFNTAVDQHGNILLKLLVPIFEDLFSLIAMQNEDRKENTLDADLKLKLERYLTQMEKAKEGKQFM